MKRLLLLTMLVPLFLVVQTASSNEVTKTTLFCKNTELTGPDFSNGSQDWTNILIDISPPAIFVTGSGYFDGGYEISSKGSSRLTIVATEGLNLMNIDRFSGELYMQQYLDQDQRKLRYILSSECGFKKPLF